MARGLDRIDLERMADALERVHRGETPGGAETGLRALAAAAAGPDRLYEEATRLFTRQEELLRSQSTAATKLLEGVRQRATTARQAVLRLQGAPRSTVGGRFVLHNESARSEAFRLIPRVDLPATVTPAEPVLTPGQRIGVDVRIELDGSFRIGETASLLIDVLVGDAPRLKLWLDVRIDAAWATP